MDEPRKFSPPVTLESSSIYPRQSDTVITGVQISLANMIGLWIKIWVAGLIAGLLIFGPFIVIIYLYEVGQQENRTKQLLETIPGSN